MSYPKVHPQGNHWQVQTHAFVKPTGQSATTMRWQPEIEIPVLPKRPVATIETTFEALGKAAPVTALRWQPAADRLPQRPRPPVATVETEWLTTGRSTPVTALTWQPEGQLAIPAKLPVATAETLSWTGGSATPVTALMWQPEGQLAVQTRKPAASIETTFEALGLSTPVTRLSWQPEGQTAAPATRPVASIETLWLAPGLATPVVPLCWQPETNPAPALRKPATITDPSFVATVSVYQGIQWQPEFEQVFPARWNLRLDTQAYVPVAGQSSTTVPWYEEGTLPQAPKWQLRLDAQPFIAPTGQSATALRWIPEAETRLIAKTPIAWIATDWFIAPAGQSSTPLRWLPEGQVAVPAKRPTASIDCTFAFTAPVGQSSTAIQWLGAYPEPVFLRPRLLTQIDATPLIENTVLRAAFLPELDQPVPARRATATIETLWLAPGLARPVTGLTWQPEGQLAVPSRKPVATSETLWLTPGFATPVTALTWQPEGQLAAPAKRPAASIETLSWTGGNATPVTRLVWQPGADPLPQRPRAPVATIETLFLSPDLSRPVTRLTWQPEAERFQPPQRYQYPDAQAYTPIVGQTSTPLRWMPEGTPFQSPRHPAGPPDQEFIATVIKTFIVGMGWIPETSPAPLPKWQLRLDAQAFVPVIGQTATPIRWYGWSPEPARRAPRSLAESTQYVPGVGQSLSLQWLTENTAPRSTRAMSPTDTNPGFVAPPAQATSLQWLSEITALPIASRRGLQDTNTGLVTGVAATSSIGWLPDLAPAIARGRWVWPPLSATVEIVPVRPVVPQTWQPELALPMWLPAVLRLGASPSGWLPPVIPVPPVPPVPPAPPVPGTVALWPWNWFELPDDVQLTELPDDVQLTDVIASPDMSQAVMIYRQNGAFGPGGWQSEVSYIPAYGMIAPATDRDVRQMAEGDRIGGALTFITATPIFTTHAGGSQPGVSDQIKWRGKMYRVASVGPWGDYGFYAAVLLRMAGD